MPRYEQIYLSKLGLESKIFTLDKESFLERAKYYYGCHEYGDTYIKSGGYGKSGRSFKELRDYARGLQSIEKYKDILDPAIKVGNKTKRRWKISWSPVNVLPKYIAQVKDRIKTINVGLNIEIDDSTAREVKQRIKNRLIFLSDPRTKDMIGDIGVELPESKIVKNIQSHDEIDLYEQMGGIKLDFEVIISDRIRDSFKKSNWDLIKSMLLDDELALGLYCIEPYYSPNTNEVLFRYIDPAHLVVRPSNYPDHRDSDFWGYTRRETPEALFMEIKDLSDEDANKIEQIAKKDRYFIDHDRLDYGDATGKNVIEDGRVEVFTLYFLASTKSKFVKGIYRSGNRYFYEISGKPRRGATLEEVTLTNLFKVNWVVGTDIIFDYGLADVIVRENNNGSKTIVPPIIIMSTDGLSFVEKTIGAVDDMNIALFKLRNIYRNLPPPPRVKIDKSIINDITRVGDIDYTVRDALAEFKMTGVLVYEKRDEYMVPGIEADYTKSAGIEPIVIDFTNDIKVLIEEIDRAINFIRLEIGFNEITDGVSPNPEMLKHVAAGAQVATNSALSELLNRWIYFNRRIGEVLAKKYSILLAVGGMNIEKELKKDLIDFVFSDYTVNVVVDTTQTKEFLMNKLMQYNDLAPNVFFSIMRAIDNSEYMKAEYLLSEAIEKYKSEEHRRSIELAQAQTVAMSQLEEQKLKAELLLLEKKYELEERLQKIKNNNYE